MRTHNAAVGRDPVYNSAADGIEVWLEQPTVTQTSTLPSSDGDNRESHSSADDTIIMSSHDNWAKV